MTIMITEQVRREWPELMARRASAAQRRSAAIVAQDRAAYLSAKLTWDEVDARIEELAPPATQLIR